MNSTDQMDELILKYIKGVADENERISVENWLSESPDNVRQFNALKSILDACSPSFEYDSIDVDKAYSDVIGKSSRSTQPFLFYFQRVAAVLFLPLVALSAFMAIRSWMGAKEQITPTQKLSVPFGAVSEFVLSDGSKVSLGSGSSLECPVMFDGKSRVVTLQGEALFNVSADTSHPFIVNAGQMSVTAVGTEFTVNSYDRDSLSIVALKKGAVNVNFASRPGTCVKMEPNDILTFHKSNSDYDVVSDDSEKWYCWTTGRIVFAKDRFDAVLTRLEQLYNAEFCLDDPVIRSYLYRATFYNEPLDEIMNIIQMSLPVSFKRRLDQEEEGGRRKYDVVVLK